MQNIITSCTVCLASILFSIGCLADNLKPITPDYIRGLKANLAQPLQEVGDGKGTICMVHPYHIDFRSKMEGVAEINAFFRQKNIKVSEGEFGFAWFSAGRADAVLIKRSSALDALSPESQIMLPASTERYSRVQCASLKEARLFKTVNGGRTHISLGVKNAKL